MESGVRQGIFKPAETLGGLLYYIQTSYPVRDFPPSYDIIWEEVVFSIASDPELGLFLSYYIDAVDILDEITLLDWETQRISIDLRDVWHGTLGRCFPDAAQRMFEIVLGMEGFIEFS